MASREGRQVAWVGRREYDTTAFGGAITQMHESIAKLSGMFSAEGFGVLTSASAPEDLREIIRCSGVKGLGRRMRIRHLFDLAYEKLLAEYRCEYIFKNELTNSIFLRNHAIRDDSARLLTEFWVGESKADLAVVNGTSTVYEIKTDLDSLARLPQQLKCYSQIFDKIFVVTGAGLLARLTDSLPRHVGILRLDESGDFQTIRDASSNVENVNVKEIFRSLRESEVVEICHRRFGVDARIDPLQRYENCWVAFRQFNPIEAHQEMIQVLRRRPIHEAQKALIDAAPRSLKHLAIGKNVTVTQYRTAAKQLDAVA